MQFHRHIFPPLPYPTYTLIYICFEQRCKSQIIIHLFFNITHTYLHTNLHTHTYAHTSDNAHKHTHRHIIYHIYATHIIQKHTITKTTHCTQTCTGTSQTHINKDARQIHFPHTCTLTHYTETCMSHIARKRRDIYTPYNAQKGL